MLTVPGNQDGGEGELGELVALDTDYGWCSVRWEASGDSNSYRIGQDGMHDLVFGPAIALVVPDGALMASSLGLVHCLHSAWFMFIDCETLPARLMLTLPVLGGMLA